MHGDLTATDWAAARGEKWRAHLPAMESTLMAIDGPLIAALELAAPARIAEVGCGGGATAIQIFHGAPAGSVVHGLDISPQLVALARGRLRPDERAVTFEVADMATAAPKLRYDRLVSRFGVMFFEDPPAAFANLMRWLAPGGRLAFAVWGAPSANPWMTSARDAVARVVELPRSDPDAPGPFRYADVTKLVAALEQAGGTGLEVHDWRGELPIGGALAPAAAARFALASFSSFGELLAAAGEDATREAHRALTACYARHQRDGAVRMGACVHIVTGTRR